MFFLLVFFLLINTGSAKTKICLKTLYLSDKTSPDDETIRTFIGQYSRSPEIENQLHQVSKDNSFLEDFISDKAVKARSYPSWTLKSGVGHKQFLEASKYVQTAVKEKRLPNKDDFIKLSSLLGEKEIRNLEAYNGGLKEFKYMSHVELSEALENLARFIQEDTGLHPIEKAAISYQYFVSIHPLKDANGRAGRLILDWILMYYDYPYCIFEPFGAAAGIFPTRLGNSTKTQEVTENVIKGIKNTIALKAKTDT